MTEIDVEFWEEFWEEVWRAMERLARAGPREKSQFDRMRGEIEGLPRHVQEIFLHTDPFDVALDVIGVRREEARDYWEAEVERRRGH